MLQLYPLQQFALVLLTVASPSLASSAKSLDEFLLDLLPKDLSSTQILMSSVGAFLIVATVTWVWTHRITSLGRLIMAAWVVAIIAIATMTGLVWLLLGQPDLQLPEELSPRALDAVTTKAFAAVAGLGGVALLVISYRRQRTTEAESVRADLAVERETTRLFTERFDSASDKLGSEHASVRLAGVHALAHLADDAPWDRDELVQMVIDVLCAYLRMPYSPAPDPLPADALQEAKDRNRKENLDFAAMREVRHTILRIIGNHLREETRWRYKDYDFTGVVFDGGDLTRAHFSGGKVSFVGAQFTDGSVIFGGANFTHSKVDFSKAKFAGGEVSFVSCQFLESHMSFVGTQLTGSNVKFDFARFSQSKVDFSNAELLRGKLSFGYAEFNHGGMDFHSTQISDCEVDFKAASGPRPVGLLDIITPENRDMVALPDEWRPSSRDNSSS